MNQKIEIPEVFALQVLGRIAKSTCTYAIQASGFLYRLYDEPQDRRIEEVRDVIKSRPEDRTGFEQFWILTCIRELNTRASNQLQQNSSQELGKELK